MAITLKQLQIHEKPTSRKPQKCLCGMARKRKLTMGKGAVILSLSKKIHPSLWVRNHHMNIRKGHQLEGMTVLRTELKKIRGKEVMAILVTGTVDDADTTELYDLEKALQDHF